MKKVKTGLELASALSAIGEQVADDADKIIQKLTLDAFRMLVDRSAVDTGFLRSQWSINVNTTPPETVKTNTGGNFAPAAYPSVSPQWGDIVVLYNNTEYAKYLEFGTVNMIARPMVEPTYAFVLSEANRLVKALSRKKVIE